MDKGKDAEFLQEPDVNATEPALAITHPAVPEKAIIESLHEDSESRSWSHCSGESHESPIISNDRPPLRHTASRASSVRRDAIKVPRNQRRGLLARFATVSEVENPYDLPNKTKWIITAVVAFAGAAAPMGSNIILPALLDISRAFHTTEVIANMSAAFYMLSMAIFPLWWSSFSETLGRRTIYITSFFLFLIFNVLSAVSVNISMFIIMRVLSGGASASVQAVGAGTIADIWEVKERGRAMGIFYLGPLCGPLIAPILGGILADFLGWRSCLWSQVIYAGILWVAIVLFLPETLRRIQPTLEEAEAEAIASTLPTDEKAGPAGTTALTRTTTVQSVKIQAKKYSGVFRKWFIDPLKILRHITKPPVALSVFYAAMTFASLYFLNISIQDTFAKPPYNYSTLIVGLLYIPNSVGYFAASVFGGPWVDRIMKREAEKAGRYDERGRLVLRPEDRMRENIWLAAFMYPIALLWYGWTAEKGVYVVAPMIANFFFGIGSMLVFGCLTTMLTEFMPKQSSHGIALNNFVRNIFACIAGVVTQPAVAGIGNGYLFTILGIFTLVSGIITVPLMKKLAMMWREHTDKAEGGHGLGHGHGH